MGKGAPGPGARMDGVRRARGPDRFQGAPDVPANGSNPISVGYGKGAFFIYDTEKLCGAPGGMGGTQYDVATDLAGVTSQGGVPMSAFLKGLFTSTGPSIAVPTGYVLGLHWFSMAFGSLGYPNHRFSLVFGSLG